MERLTFEGNFCDIAQCREVRYGSFCEDGYCLQRRVWEKLKRYEDLEEQGRLVILPAKTVYELTWDAGPNCDLVCPVSIDGEGQCDFCDRSELCIYERECKQEHIPLIGKTVFLSLSAAEAALAASVKEG